MNRKRMILINSSIILLVFLAIFFVKPAYLGYTTYQGMKATNTSVEDYGINIQELKDEMLVSNTNLSTCYDFNQILINQLELSLDDLVICNQQVADYAVLGEKYKTEISERKKEIKEKNDLVEEFKSRYDNLVQNLANKICCKSKVDNSRIRYYDVQNNNILCLEDGEKEISCFFE